MKKLFVLAALCGLGLFMIGCGEPAANPTPESTPSVSTDSGMPEEGGTEAPAVEGTEGTTPAPEGAEGTTTPAPEGAEGTTPAPGGAEGAAPAPEGAAAPAPEGEAKPE
ncbi:MAG TPA: hypothetical protein VFV87_19840 [Pirellulaceae bacterium]|nr:hypothetical protein [Pirellulaceae bacterium]